MTKLFFAAIICIALIDGNKLVGRWESRPSVNGNITGVVFKEDNSFEAYVNDKPFTSGNYMLRDSIFSMRDLGCNGEEGIYKIDFFSKGDSMRFELISDPCTERANGVVRLVLGRTRNR